MRRSSSGARPPPALRSCLAQYICVSLYWFVTCPCDVFIPAPVLSLRASSTVLPSILFCCSLFLSSSHMPVSLRLAAACPSSQGRPGSGALAEKLCRCVSSFFPSKRPARLFLEAWSCYCCGSSLSIVETDSCTSCFLAVDKFFALTYFYELNVDCTM